MAENVVNPGIRRFVNLDDIGPVKLKQNYLFGLEFLDTEGKPYPDDFFYDQLSRALSELERAAQIRVNKIPIVDEKHDYDVRDYTQFAYLKLFEPPVLSVEEVRLVYPTGATVFKIPNEWVRLYKENGQLHLVPTQGSLSSVILGQGGSYLPLIYQGMGYLPDLFHVDYTSGFPPDAIPFSIYDAVMKLATMDTLRVAGDALYPPGATSLSIGIDGLSQSKGLVNPPFKGRLDQYQMELYGDGRTKRGLIEDIKTFYHGLNMRVA